MDIKSLTVKIRDGVTKYKYAALVLVIGVGLLLLPNKNTKQGEPVVAINTETQSVNADALAQILKTVDGAGEVQVMLSVGAGEKTVYQTDTDMTADGESSSTKTQTVLTTDSQRNETGLISQINPPEYLGAIVVCEGADNSAVRLALTQAVAKITGLGSDKICVLKMK